MQDIKLELPEYSTEQMGQDVLAWHNNCHEQLNQLQNVPEHDKQIIVDEDTGEEHELTGTELKAFKQGISVAQQVFLKLPFQVITADDQQDA